MTSVVAYAEPGYAFVGADTRRRPSFMDLPTIKVHTWGENVVFSQSGNANHLSQCIGIMMAFRGTLFDTDIWGFKAAFSQYQPVYQRHAQESEKISSHVSVNGTLLAADAQTGTIISCDFATGAISTIPAPAFCGDPLTRIHMNTAWGSGRKDLAHWACESISPLCSAKGSVDWPIDILISRPYLHNYQTVIGSRLQNTPPSPFPLFEIP